MLAPESCCGSSARVPELSGSPLVFAARTVSSTSRSRTGLAAGQERSLPAHWTPSTKLLPSVSSELPRTCRRIRAREAHYMFSRFLSVASIAIGLAYFQACTESALPRQVSLQRVLRVCADPNNLPFSNRQGEGFENRITQIIAGDMDARLEYTWFAQRRGFLRNTLRAGQCDVAMGIPFRLEGVDTTLPYYRSTYVFVSRERDQRSIHSLDDPILRTLKIGVHIIGDDYSNPPPVHALGRRKIVNNISGYPIYGDYSKPNPP